MDLQRSSTFMKWIALLAFGGVGLFALISGLMWGGNRYALSHNGVHVQGEVVEYYTDERTTTREERREGRANVETYYYPVIEFPDQKEKLIRFKAATGTGAREFEIGSTVALVYDPADPYDAMIDTFSHLWEGPIIVSIVGLIMFIMGVVTFYLMRE